MALLICLVSLCFIFVSVVCTLSHRPFYENSLKFLDETPDDYKNYRLPKTLKPTHYDLKLAPDLNNGSFKGWVTIYIDVQNSTETIVLNFKNTSIYSESMKASIHSDTQPLSIADWWMNTTFETVTYQLNATLSVQQGVQLHISYTGRLTDNMLGFYLSKYTTANSTNHLLAVTQFESTHARQAFPCFDEPAYRANFSLSVYRLPNQSSLSNMPLQFSEQDNDTGLTCDVYYETPLIPTYLFAVVVSDFEYLKSDNFRVYTRKTALNDANYTLTIGPKILKEIGSTLGVPYPLPKMDVVAVPDFNAGAMENWGLTTFRERLVLYNPVINSWLDKFMVLSVVAHEFGHQWFGDLVTPEWWDYTWLNEAFATYFEYTIPHKVEPTWKIYDMMFVVEAVQPALAMDTGAPRPMTSPVYTPTQIDKIFDYVIYDKGGSVVRMFANCLQDVFNKGLKIYLENNAYSTGTPEELFYALNNAANGSVPNLIETLNGWTTTPGYPLITVQHYSSNSSSDASGNLTVYKITQAPYGFDGNVSYEWNVPLTFTTEEQPEFNSSKASKHWQFPSDPNSSYIKVNGSGWIIFNIGQTGFYRVNYDDNNWHKINRQLKRDHSVISSSINRAQLIDDAFHLAKTGHLPYSLALNLSGYIPGEKNFPPFNSFFKNMKFLINKFYGTTTGNTLKLYAQNIMQGPFNAMISNISTFTSTFEGSLMLMKATEFAYYIELPACQERANIIFKDYSKNINLILPEVKKTVICAGLHSDTSKDTLNNLLGYYKQSNNGAEKQTLLESFGCVDNSEVAKMYMDFVCDSDGNNVRPQDHATAIKALVSNQNGLPFVLQYMVENFTKVQSCLGSRINSVVSTLAATISQENHINKVISIINDPSVDQQLRELLNSTVLPSITKHQAWLASEQVKNLELWTRAFVNSASPSLSHIVLTISMTLLCIFISLN